MKRFLLESVIFCCFTVNIIFSEIRIDSYQAFKVSEPEIFIKLITKIIFSDS